jgi:hypothetical protein
VSLQGDEIGKLVAQSLEAKISDRRPWYSPADKMPDEPLIITSMVGEFDSVVVDMPSARNSAGTASGSAMTLRFALRN